MLVRFVLRYDVLRHAVGDGIQIDVQDLFFCAVVRGLFRRLRSLNHSQMKSRDLQTVMLRGDAEGQQRIFLLTLPTIVED